MENRKKMNLVIVLLLCAVLLASCSAPEQAGDAELIGSYPGRSNDTSYDTLPENAVVVYHAQIDLQVGSIADAIDEIMALAGKFGGYTTYIYSWYQDSENHATIIVSVPSFNYDSLHRRIIRLGDLQDETIIGELNTSSYRGSSQIEMSTITVHLTEKGWGRPSSSGSWRPLNTLSDAFEVAAVIFRFLIDALIWVTVIAGPFVLIGWGIRQIARHWQITVKKKDQEN